jgi:transposase InsO family protein
MGLVGCALDNAAAEAFNSSLKVEYVHRHRFRTRAEARAGFSRASFWINATTAGSVAGRPILRCG